ncbi:MAG: HAD hydrolase family protein [Gemmatimonadales bacterium]|jgi:3-deoxy-D-manno-octulosonate 8-phosphate phosphatase (KDO 8-P phosphatase)
MPEGATIAADIARAVKLVVLDVDGVMTDGGVYYGASKAGETVELKRFEITDGLGVLLMQEAGIEVAIVTGRRSKVVELRARELAIDEVHQDPAAEKLPIVSGILLRRKIDWSEVAFVSDDLADIPVLRRVGLPVAVANAAPEVSTLARWQTSRPGGAGAVREFAEALLKARGDWTTVVDRYLAKRDPDSAEGAGREPA